MPSNAERDSIMTQGSPVVLIVEDNPGLARVLSYKFNRAGFPSLICMDGQEAWEAFQTNKVAAVVSDQEMPRMSGIELFRNIQSSDPYVPLFLITGHQMELASSGVQEELEIAHIFGKPFSPATVIAEVSRAIETRRAGGQLAYMQ